MDLAQLSALVQKQREFYSKFPPNTLEPGITLKVNRKCKGERCRLCQGVTGKIVFWGEDHVIAVFLLQDIEKVLDESEKSK